MKKLLYCFIVCTAFYACDLVNPSVPVVQKDGALFITKNADWQEVLDSVSPYLSDEKEFINQADKQGYKAAIKPGKYKLKATETGKSLVARLKAGLQEEVNVRIKNEPTFEHLAGSLSRQMDVDSAAMVQGLKKWGQSQFQTQDTEVLKQYFLPNTYRFYWSPKPQQVIERLYKEYKKFWTAEREQKAKESGMSKLQITTLASITQMEAPKADEQARVAQAYLNRLNKGMKLEADPTSLYAYKLENGFTKIQRVYNKHLKVESPYNTYRVKGLPPAPICLPNSTAIEAVLSPEKHDYIYFCADPDRPGYHSFAANFAEHEKNAIKYRNWLRKEGIR